MINRHRNHWLPLLTLLLLGWSASAWAQPSILVVLEQETALFGEAVPLQIVAVAEAGTTIDAFDYRALENQDNMEVLDAKRLDKAGEGNSSISTLDLKLIFWEEGRYTIPPVTLTYTTNGQQEQIQSDNASILIRTMDVASDTTRLMPIKDIIEEPLGFRDFLPYILVGLVAIIIIALIFYWISRGKKGRPAPLSPEREVALRVYMEEELQRLEQSESWANGNEHGFQIELNHLLRFYLDCLYDLHTREKTSPQIVQSLREQAFPHELLPKLNELLQKVDLVKFAKAIPSEQFHRDALQQIREVIQQTKDEQLFLRFYPNNSVTIHRKQQEKQEGTYTNQAPMERVVLEGTRQALYTLSNKTTATERIATGSLKGKSSKPSTGSIAPRLDLARFWPRFFARLIDINLIPLLYLAISFGIGELVSAAELETDNNWFLPTFIVFSIVFFWLCYAYMEHRFGGTMGKLILGIRVVDKQEQYPSLKTASIRFIGKLISEATFWLGYLPYFFDKQGRQTLHDRMAGTYVIRKPDINWSKDTLLDNDLNA
ncbi:MAG: RDD family protein [Phaeodactylibacter xiamenensis]|uniref:RDD domain-containing protein n=1 Tax=Phaeodactylibacter xiamenensis TaxID=1524460 RepID=A0A098S835_9BACT|nr:RDD family protein [Phaeodactylibacter xiamenensis]KGE88739.1 hypothetical protein IX84_08795 [Phaeodactylibacter xiamenensis]MCR9053309.1 RDD family protein [bacterium]